MAVPTYVGAGVLASGTGALTPGDPTHLANDILILAVVNTHTATTDATLSDAQDYTAIGTAAVNSGSFGGLRAHVTLFWKRATGSSDNAPTVADNGEQSVARIYAFRGCTTSGNPWDVISTTGDNDGNSSLSIAGATTTEDECLVCVFAGAFTNQGETLGSWTNADLANVTERDDTSTSIAGEEVHIALTTGEMATAGAYGATTATWSTNGVYWVTAGVTIALKPDTAVVPDLAEGTTLAALQAGSGSFKYTVAIEGYQHLLTDATPQQAIDAWSGVVTENHYESALGGLYVSMNNSQQLDWKNPFPRGGHLTLHVMPDASDTFGIDTHKRSGTGETELRETIDRADADIDALDGSSFAASGEAWIGTECFEYSAITGDTFNTTQRGKYAPMCCDTAGLQSGIGFAQYHRYGQNDLEVLLAPRITSVPRVWIGKWVAVHLHVYDASIPALNSKEDSLRVFAGKIVAITDDPATGATVVEVKHVLDCVAEATVGGRDQWSGEIRNTIQLVEGMTFKARDGYGYTTANNETANDLVVKDTPVGSNQCQSGEYTHVEIYGILMTWLTAEKGAARLGGTYSIGYFLPDDGSMWTDIYWQVPSATSNEPMWFILEGPQPVFARFGFINDGASGTVVNGHLMSTIKSGNETGGAFRSTMADYPMYKVVATGASNSNWVATIDNAQGTFVDQWDTLPAPVKPSASAGDGYGLFVINDKFVAVGYKSGNQILNLVISPDQFGLEADFPDTHWTVPMRQDKPEYTPIRQIFALELTLAEAILRVFKSTGTPGYNDVTWDTLGHGLGIGIPHDITRGAFVASVNALPHSDSLITLLIDRTTRLSELLAGELIIRRAFLRWKTGGLEFGTWKTPTEANTVGTLTESNKAAPAGNIDHHRSVTSENGAWAMPTVKIQYNRSLTASPGGAENYRDNLTIIDKASLDDMGGDGPTLTVNLRGTFGNFASTASTADSLAAGFMSTMPLFSRPARMSSRSIDQRYFEGYSIGDIMLVDDEYARDPDTGLRGVSRYGIILRHSYSLGGFTPNSDKAEPQGGDIDFLFLDVNRVAVYVPTAQVDDTAGSGGYAASVLTCYAHKHSEGTEAADATRFVAGDKIRIVEIDPSDPAAPISWDREVLSQTGNTITLTSALSSPAWDSTKRYRVIFDDYADAVTTQRTKSFQADDADGLVANLRQPYEYGVGGGDGSFTAWTADDMIELPPNSSYGDGVGRDVGTEVGLVRLLNNLANYKTSVSSPELLDVAADMTAVSFGTATWRCISVRPVWLGRETLLGDVYRKVAVAPHYASHSGGSASVRVSISRTPPTTSTYFDVNRGSIVASTTFTTTSTTYSTPTPVELDARVKDFDGRAWVYVELNSAAKCWGLSHLQVTSIRFLHTLF